MRDSKYNLQLSRNGPQKCIFSKIVADVSTLWDFLSNFLEISLLRHLTSRDPIFTNLFCLSYLTSVHIWSQLYYFSWSYAHTILQLLYRKSYFCTIFLQHLNKHSFATNHRRRMVDPSLERYYKALIEIQHLVDPSMIIFADVRILSALLGHVTPRGQISTKICKRVSLLYILPVPIFEVVCVCITKVVANLLLPIVHMEHLKIWRHLALTKCPNPPF